MNTTNPKLDDVLHDFGLAEALSETHLSDKLKRKVITADEYDDLLVENYRDSKKKAKQTILSDLLAIVGEDDEIEWEYIRTNNGEVLGPMTDNVGGQLKNQLRAELRAKIQAYVGVES